MAKEKRKTGKEEAKKSPAEPNVYGNEKATKGFFIVLLAILLILGAMLVYMNLKTNPAKGGEKFEYRGIDFNVNNESENRTLYETAFNINRKVNGSYTDVETTFIFGKDPRELYSIWEKISYFLGLSPSENITFIKDSRVYISYKQQTSSCIDAFPAAYGLTQFLKQRYDLSIKGATTDISAVSKNVPFADCGNSTNNTVIIVGEGKYTGFRKLSENCYEISFKKCEIQKATEKFQLAVLEQDFVKK